MTHLSSFSKQEAELLISLPYRVCVWIGNADDEDGERDDKQEQKALEACLKAIAKIHQARPFMADIIKQTLGLRMEWKRWGMQDAQVPEDAQKAISLLRSKATEPELKNYRAALLEIAATVAQAYGEFGAFDESSDHGVFGGIVSCIVDGFSGLAHDDAGHPMNVSAAEDSALSRLAQALKI